MAKATTASATAAEKDAEKVQAVENTTTEEKATETANKQGKKCQISDHGKKCDHDRLPEGNRI